MNKPRFYLSLIALLFVIGAGLLLWPAHRAGISKTSDSPTARVVSAASIMPATAVSTKPSMRVVFHAPAAANRAQAPGSLAIGNLLADSSLDNKAVMSGLAKMTLDADRSIEERTEAMGNLLNLSAEEPSVVLLPLIGDAHLPDTLCDQILDDSLNDSLAWQADASLAALTHRSSNELKAKARDHLAFLTGSDHGDNLVEWSHAIAASKEKWAQLQP